MIEHFLPAASTSAKDVDWLFDLIFYLVGFWFVVSEGVFFWLILRFRKRDGTPAQYITGEKKEEKRWITIPHLLVLVCDIFIIYGAVKVWYEVKQDLPPAQATIRAIAQQWAWTFVQPGPDGVIDTADDITTMNELHLRSDTTYHFLLESKDVLHDLAIPAFRLKQDAIPGRVITGWFKPTRPGEYGIECAEICGIGHALMPARLYVETPEQHAAWMASHHSTVSLASATRAPRAPAAQE